MGEVLLFDASRGQEAHLGEDLGVGSQDPDPLEGLGGEELQGGKPQGQGPLHLGGGEDPREVGYPPGLGQGGHLLQKPRGDEEGGPGLEGGFRFLRASHRARSQKEAAFP